MTSGELVRSHRIARDLTITAVAKLCGVSRPHMSRLEHDKSVVTGELAVKLEKAIGALRYELRPDLYIIGWEGGSDGDAN